MPRRRLCFAAPLVVIAVAPACGSKDEPAEPPPRRARDAGVAAARPPDAQAIVAIPVDAAPPAPPVDAAPLPEADPGALVYQLHSSCYARPDARQVRCPPGGAPVVIDGSKRVATADGEVRFSPWSMRCQAEVAVDCPPPSVATCNPPPPREVPCPPELLPVLSPGVQPTEKKGGDCFLQDVQVACPPELPPPPTDRLVVATGPRCYPVGSYDEVACPPGGATVVLPTVDRVDTDGGRYVYLRQNELACYETQDVSCPPDISCNPPAPRPVECPPELLPRLAGDAKPTRQGKDGCYWKTTRVACP